MDALNLQTRPAEAAPALSELTNRPSPMYDDAAPSQVPEAPPQLQQAPPQVSYAPPPPAPPAQVVPVEVHNRLRALENQNQLLQEKAELADMYETLLRERPELAEQFLAAFSPQGTSQPTSAVGPESAVPPAPASTSSPQYRGMDPRALHELKSNFELLRLQQEAMELERDYPPDVFNRQQVASYARAHGFSSLRAAFNGMVGEAISNAYRVQRQAPQQQQQYAPQQYAPQYAPPPQQAPTVAYPIPSGPPEPAAYVNQPGARAHAPAPPAPAAQDWNGVHAQMMGDAQRLGLA